MKRQRRRGAIAIIFSMIPLMNSMNSPRIAQLHTVDFLQIYASGMAFGAGIALVISSFRNRAQSPPDGDDAKVA
jgi:hypothetical protein